MPPPVKMNATEATNQPDQRAEQDRAKAAEIGLRGVADKRHAGEHARGAGERADDRVGGVDVEQDREDDAGEARVEEKSSAATLTEMRCERSTAAQHETIASWPNSAT